MRAGRLLSILLTLQARGRATAADLARELEVSVRTIHRDMDALSLAGVPVYAERGPNGGWLLPPGYRSGPRGLDADELRALFLATPGTVLGDLGLDRASESALTKLLLALPAGDRQRLAQARQKVLIDVATWRASQVEAVPCLAALYDALRHERRVHLTYARADGVRIERLVNPLGLVAKGLIWYLVATVDAGEPRTYRVSRIVSARTTDLPADAPPAFDLAAYWEQSKARLVAGVPRFPVRVRAHASILVDLGARARWSRVVSIGRADADGWSIVDMEFELEEDVCAFVLSHGACLELVRPRHLRDRVAQQVRAAAALYAR